ncbi:MAG: OmpA family protein [Elusimicrobiales bacterium]|nr:OmpA family protein [Elusimicrobiales bacterium]
MRKFSFLLACALAVCGCAKQLTPAEREEARRADLELKGVMDLVSSREIPPVEFEFNSDRLKPTSYELLDRIAHILINHNRMKLIVSGHTDDVGSEEYNDDLSMRRASAVKFYLAKKGVYPDSVRVYGQGERQPVIRETTEQARALNRRVEFRITTRDWGTVY